MLSYNLHSSKNGFYGFDEPKSLKDIGDLAKSMGLDMVECSIPDGLNTYEDQHPDKAVVFDVSSEDVVSLGVLNGRNSNLYVWVSILGDR
jgi:hypothetical protein